MPGPSVRSSQARNFMLAVIPCMLVLAGCGPDEASSAAGEKPSPPATPADPVGQDPDPAPNPNPNPNPDPEPPQNIPAPAAPANLAATAGDGSVSLAWSASNGATSYLVRRSTTSGGPYAQVASVSGAAMVDSGVANGTTYFYVVSAVNAGGESPPSNQASASPVAPLPQASLVISPATAVVAQGGSVQFSASITGLASQAVVWSIQESGSAGTISATGRYAAPAVSGIFHVVAASATNAAVTATATVEVKAPAGTVPKLVPGVWTELTPPVAGLASTFGTTNLEVSPVNPDVIYVTADERGLWRTTDRGSTWTRLGTPGAYQGNGRTNYLDSPWQVEVNPADPDHLVATQGVRGSTLGFWVSRDGGQSWTMPQGFINVAKSTTYDVTSMAINPVDFNHILLGSHSPWGSRGPGIMETRDGGNTWTLHEGPGWPIATAGVDFLYHPASGQGNASTWLVTTDGAGFWRTTNGGQTWTKVANYSITHGGSQIYYAKDGTLYSGAANYPVYSRDNGLTWKQMSDGLPYWYYYTVYGDGDTLYTQLAYTGTNAGQGLQPYMTTSESNPGKWVPYQGGSQKFTNGPFVMKFDAANDIMYSVNWNGGVWALKVIRP